MPKGKTFIIAEAGINHNGSLITALQMIDVAAECKVDAIKFQTSFGFKDQGQWEFTRNQWREIFSYCDLSNITWFSTPFDFESIDFLNECGMDIWKIPSGMVTVIPLLKKISSIKPKQIVLSTGMCTIEEIDKAVFIMIQRDRDNITILQCTTVYPSPFNEVNLSVMATLKEIFNCNVGLSDHTRGIEIPIAAVAMGASIIEKHFTLDRNMEGPDHKASLEPNELREMVKCIRNVEMAMGDGIKRPTASELKFDAESFFGTGTRPIMDEIRKSMSDHVSNTI